MNRRDFLKSVGLSAATATFLHNSLARAAALPATGRTGSLEDIFQSRTTPLSIHYRGVFPIDTFYLLDSCAHSMASVAGTLQNADNGVLLKVILQV
jgi:hypothetical protein